MKDVTSKHLRTSTELTLVAPIKQGFIEYVDTMSYAARLRLLLNTLFELRKGADERSPGKVPAGKEELEFVGPQEQLQTLHFVQFAVFDNDTKLMLNVTFDKSWESYIRDIVDIAGPLLDAIFCHCADYEGHSTNLGYETFARWVREHQVGNDFFFSAEPGMTSDDRRLHKELAGLPSKILKQRQKDKQSVAAPIGAELEQRVAALRLTAAQQTDGTFQDMQRIASALFDLRRYFAGGVTPTLYEFLSTSARQDLVFFDEVAYALLSGFGAQLKVAGKSPSEQLLASWYGRLEQRKPAELEAARKATIPFGELKDIQRGLLTPFPRATHGCLVLVQWPDRAKAVKLLQAVLKRVSTEDKSVDPKDTSDSVSLALTFRGLASLDLTDDELRAFPKEFRDGMEARCGILGDVEASHPSTWQVPVSLGSVDAVLLLQSYASCASSDDELSTRAALQKRLDTLLAGCEARVLHVEPLRREYEGDAMIEHFGFRDDISQPYVAFEPPEKAAPRDVVKRDLVAPGELVLGYPNDRGETARFAPKGTYDPAFDLTKNGSFLVLRKLEQHVDRFDKFITQSITALDAEHAGVSAVSLKEQIMGRKPGVEATPLIDNAPKDGTAQHVLNDFDFKSDVNRCPFHAHIRRVNPRESEIDPKDRSLPQRTTPRILRRSFSYGPLRGTKEHKDASCERGLMFMALNASIADQYEMLQRWINGGNSTGVASSLADLLAGSNKSAFPVQLPNNKGMRWLPPPAEPLVSLRWGMYAFVPSLNAIKLLIERAGAPGTKADSARGMQLFIRGLGIIAKLQALPESIAKVEWKRLLESRDTIEDAQAIWAAVLKTGGALRTPYGVLVAGKRNVYDVLEHPDTYSVREYWHRMEDSIGELHLGMDPDRKPMPQASTSAKDKVYQDAVQPGTYASIAGPLNAAIYAIGIEHGFTTACEVTTKALAGLPQNVDTGTKVCDVRDVSAGVLQLISARWFGMPTQPSSLSDFRQCSAYVFTANPEPWVAAGARTSAKAIHAANEATGVGAFKAIVAEQAAMGLTPSFPDKTDKELLTGLTGAAFGFLAATLGSLVNALLQWIDSGQLWRLQQTLPALGNAARAEDLKTLQDQLLAALQRGPVPPMLHRQVLQPAQLGPVALVPGDRVVVALGTVPVDDPEDKHIMFGGKYAPLGSSGPGSPVHACPGREMAIGVMMGFVWTLLQQQDLRRVSELSPLKLSFKD